MHDIASLGLLSARHFTAATQTALGRSELLVDGMPSFSGLRKSLRAAGLALPAIESCLMEDVCSNAYRACEPHEIDIPAPREGDDDGHYIFARGRRRARATRIYELTNCYLSFDVRVGGSPQFYLFDERGRLVDGYFYGAAPFIEDVRSAIRPGVFVDDRWPSPNVCHYLYDKFTKAALARDVVGPCDAVVARTPHFLQLVEAEGYPHFVLEHDRERRRGSVFFRKLFIYEGCFGDVHHPAYLAHPAHVAPLRRLGDRVRMSARRAGASRPQGAGRRRGGRYLAMRDPASATRTVVNGREFDAVMRRWQVEPVDFGALSPRAQIEIASHAELLVGVHGAGLTHLAFMPPGAAVVELLPPLCATPAYWIMAHGMGLQYHHLVCEDPVRGVIDASRGHHDVQHIRRDVVVPADRLSRLLERIVTGTGDRAEDAPDESARLMGVAA